MRCSDDQCALVKQQYLSRHEDLKAFLKATYCLGTTTARTFLTKTVLQVGLMSIEWEAAITETRLQQLEDAILFTTKYKKGEGWFIMPKKELQVYLRSNKPGMLIEIGHS